MAASLVRRVFLQQTTLCKRIVTFRQYCESPTGKDGSDLSKEPPTNKISTKKEKKPSHTQAIIESMSEEEPKNIHLGGLDFNEMNELHSTNTMDTKATEKALNKFGYLVEKFKKQKQTEEDEMMRIQRLADSGNDTDIFVEDDKPQESFATMLRKSKLVSLGEYDGRVLVAKIIEVMDDDLYIDFGGKFHCVCPRPRKDPT